MIVAEDIADFPDLNLAESLQRVPGVVIARDAGEGRQISVRGLGPQFTRVRINGVEAMSANGGTDAAGGTNRGRNFDFNTFASELFNNITVRKTASADVEEGSLGATVDLRTGRPFDYRRPHDRGRRAARLQRPHRRFRSARHLPHQQHVRRRQVRRAALGGLHQARARRRGIEHGALDELGQPDDELPHAHAGRREYQLLRRSRSGLHGHADARADQQRVPSAHSALRPVPARAGAPRRHRVVAVRAERRDHDHPRCAVCEVRCHAFGDVPRNADLQHGRQSR